MKNPQQPTGPFRILISLPLLALVSCDKPSDKIPFEKPSDKIPFEHCGADDLLRSEVLSTTRVERTRGKQEPVLIDFTVDDGDEVCIHVSTGKVSGAGVLERAAAAVSIELDQDVLVAAQNEFNAHPQEVTRLISGLGGGGHSLAVDINGKPESTAYISVLRKSTSSSAQSMPLITFDRLQNPTVSETFVRDEAIIALESFEDISKLDQLPFSTVPISSLEGVPIFRIYLPGVDSQEELESKLLAIEEVDGVLSAGKHRIGGVKPAQGYLPQSSGQDKDYLNYSWGGEASLDSDKAWHLTQINADKAWTEANVSGHHTIGILDSGFNSAHPGFYDDDGVESNIDGCWYPDPKTHIVTKFACEEDDETPTGIAPPIAQCIIVKNLTQEYNSHGTAVAGLIGARGETDIGGGFADTLGLLWRGHMSFARWNQSAVLPSEDSIYADDADLQQCWVDGIPSDYGIILTAEQMIRGGASVINMSFGNNIFDDDDNWTSAFDNPATREGLLADVLKTHQDLWSRLLESYSTVLIVQSAGNSGRACEKNIADSKYCLVHSNGYACSIQDPLLEKQVLCVGASDKDAEMWDGTNHIGDGGIGDRIAAPGAGVYVMTYDGPTGTGEGTSLAAPLVAAAASMLMDENPQLHARVVHDFILTGGSSLPIEYDDEFYRILDVESSLKQVRRCMNKYQTLESGKHGCPTFSDNQDTDLWYYQPVQTLACNCILDGDPEGTFRPGDVINRVEAIKVALELALPDEDFSPTQTAFVDVPEDAWYSGYVKYADDHGILEFMTGNGNHLFPDAEIDRAEFIQILVKAAEFSDGSVDGMVNLWQAFDEGGAPDFAYSDVVFDTPGVSEIYASTAQCITTGYANTKPPKFGPGDALKRAEAAKIGCLALYGYGSRQCGENPDPDFCTPYLK